MTIAITGASGQFGRLVIRGLAARIPATDIIGLARSTAKAADLGVTIREADYDTPEMLDAALTGVDTLLLVSASEFGKRAVQHHTVIEAATRAGVKWIVHTSLLHADASTTDLAAEHRATEADVKASGIPFTFLRNGWYTENYASSIAGGAANGIVIGYELGGDAAWTLADLAAEIGGQVGRAVPYQDMSADAYATTLAGFGVPAGFAQRIAGWDVATAGGALFEDGRLLSVLLARPTTSMSATVAQLLKPAA